MNPETTPEEYRQRALLLADLGRYDEAAGEIAEGLGSVPDEPGLLATLARIHLAAEQPIEALVAAERAVTAAPAVLTALVVRAMALTDNQRYSEAAQVAGDILRQWPADPYAQRTGAALLSESRNGQDALNAAWNGVRVAPSDAEAHLVLAVVAARLRLFDLAQRAYAEALELDGTVAEAQRDVGIVRFERRRWAIALEQLADQAALPVPTEEDRQGDGAAEGKDEAGKPYPEPFPRPYPAPDRPDETPPPAHTSTSWTDQPVVSRPSKPVLDPSGDSAEAVRWGVQVGANIILISAVVAGAMTLVSPGISRAWGGMIGVLALAGVLIALNRRLTEPLGTALTRLRAHDRRMAIAFYLCFAAPILLVVYAAVGGVVPLVAAMGLAAVAELLLYLRR